MVILDMLSFVGDINSDCGITVYEWCRYTKRNLCIYTTLDDVTINEHNLPQALFVDAKFINFSKQLDKLESFADMGITVVFCTLPSYDDFLENIQLRDFCGISLVARNIKTVGYKLYEGFLFGGETWYLPENEEQEEMYQDLKLDVPWYQTTNSTKTYMSAIVDPSRYEYLKMKNSLLLYGARDMKMRMCFVLMVDLWKIFLVLQFLTALCMKHMTMKYIQLLMRRLL